MANVEPIKSRRRKPTAVQVTLPPDRAGFTVAEVARLLAISQSQVYLMMERGDLVNFHIGKARRITADSISDYINRQIAAEERSI